MLLTPAVMYETPGDAGGGSSAMESATPFSGSSEPSEPSAPESGSSEPAARTEPSSEPAQPARESAPTSTSSSQTPGPGPWDADLRERFQDDSTRSQVDAYLREKWQPHVTQLEQNQYAEEGHKAFWDDFTEAPEQTTAALLTQVYADPETGEAADPAEAVLGLVEDLYGEEVADAIEQAFEQALDGDGEPGGQPEEPVDVEQWLEGAPPEIRAALEHSLRSAADTEEATAHEEFVGEVGTLLEANADAFPPNVDPEKASALLAPFVITHDGDLDAAFEAYQAWRSDIEGGDASPEEAAAASAAGLEPGEQTAPPTLKPGGSSTPTVEKYESIEDAARAFTQELQAKRAAPPTV